MHRSLLILLLIAACDSADSDDSPIRPTGPVERYGFVTTLGNDTVGIERIALAADALISESVDRWPTVRERHTALAIAPDGRLTRMTMEVRTPNGATPAERWRKVRARFTEDSVHVTIEDSSGSTGRSFATGGALTVPHISMQYAVIEFTIASAIQRAAAAGQGVGDTLAFRQFYPDRDVGPRFVLHRGRVIPLTNGRVELQHDWLAGTGGVMTDSAGRMLSYSGHRTTYKVDVVRTGEIRNVPAIAAAMAAAEQRAGPNRLSMRDTATGTIGAATISVDYGRPVMRGRVLLGNVIEYNKVWRTGANEATHFTTSAPITLAGLSLPAGSYTLWTLPRENGVELIVNRETGQWGTSYDASRNLGSTPLDRGVSRDTTQLFTISILPRDSTHGALRLAWGTWTWTAPITVRPATR